MVIIEQNKSGFERPGDLEFEDYSQGINRASSDSSLGTPKGPMDLLGKNKSKNFWLFKRSKVGLFIFALRHWYDVIFELFCLLQTIKSMINSSPEINDSMICFRQWCFFSLCNKCAWVQLRFIKDAKKVLVFVNFGKNTKLKTCSAQSPQNSKCVCVELCFYTSNWLNNNNFITAPRVQREDFSHRSCTAFWHKVVEIWGRELLLHEWNKPPFVRPQQSFKIGVWKKCGPKSVIYYLIF